MDKRRGGQGHGSGSLLILHQAVTWSLTSPLYNDTIHLTGVYIFPDENQLQEFFDTLIAHSNHSPHEPHIYAGDFNAYTAEELENHITPQELRTLLRRSGNIREKRRENGRNVISFRGMASCGQQHGLAMNWVDQPRTSADEQDVVCSPRCRDCVWAVQVWSFFH